MRADNQPMPRPGQQVRVRATGDTATVGEYGWIDRDQKWQTVSRLFPARWTGTRVWRMLRASDVDIL